MQELTNVECYRASVGQTGQLKDMRDGKYYWVTKLADGNCWMTQNLDYDGGGTKISAPSGWTTSGSSAAVTNTTAAYYDPGDYYWTNSNSTSWTACSNNGTGLSACTSNGWATTGDSHYHIGNYYSWLAATNGSGTSATTKDDVAVTSICPGGWELPKSGDTYNINNGSFYKLVTTTYNITKGSDIDDSPLYLIPGGRVYSGNLNEAGSNGFYWSSTATNSTSAYLLYFSSSSVSPSNYQSRYIGMPVRCLVQGS